MKKSWPIGSLLCCLLALFLGILAVMAARGDAGIWDYVLYGLAVLALVLRALRGLRQFRASQRGEKFHGED